MSYVRFGATLLVSLAVMLVLSMSMIRRPEHFMLNLGNFWIALVMVAAMGVVMLIAMWNMFPSGRRSGVALAALAVLFVAGLALGRTGGLIGDRQFLESMIPHHSRAILICQESDLTDPEILRLCDQIVASQQAEIDQMTQILERY